MQASSTFLRLTKKKNLIKHKYNRKFSLIYYISYNNNNVFFFASVANTEKKYET